MGSWVQLGNLPGEALATSSLMLSPFATLVSDVSYLFLSNWQNYCYVVEVTGSTTETL